MNDAFELEGLTTYPELNGTSWSTLDPRFRDHINNRTLRCITILKETHPQIKYDVFERLNTGAVQLNAQELRHGLNYGPLIKVLDELNKDETWKKAVGIRNDKRMKGAELVLRYFAFRHDRTNYAKPLTSFLDQFTNKYRSLPDAQVNEWAGEFRQTFSRVSFGLGRLAFRLYDAELDAPTAFNAALYDAEMIAFAETTNPVIIQGHYRPTSLQSKVYQLFENKVFYASIRQATSDEASVKHRIEIFSTLLNRFEDAV